MDNLPDLAVVRLSHTLPLEDLDQLCESSSRFQQLLCGNPNYWRDRYFQTIPKSSQINKPETQSWKDFYWEAVGPQISSIYFSASEFDYYYEFSGNFYSATTLKLTATPPDIARFEVVNFDPQGFSLVAILIGDIRTKISGVLYQIDSNNEINSLHDVTVPQIPLKFKVLSVPDWNSSPLNATGTKKLSKLPKFPMKPLTSSLLNQFKAAVEIIRFFEYNNSFAEIFTEILDNISEKTPEVTKNWIGWLFQYITDYLYEESPSWIPTTNPFRKFSELSSILSYGYPYFIYNWEYSPSSSEPFQNALIHFPAITMTFDVKHQPGTNEIFPGN